MKETTKMDYLLEHNLTQRDGLSRWSVIFDGRKRIVQLQKYKGRLYLFGIFTCGPLGWDHPWLKFEATLCQVLKALGPLKLEIRS